MIVYYFGADAPWKDQDETSIRRRNMALLLAIAQNEHVTKVYNIIRTQRVSLFKKSESNSSLHPKIGNVFIAPIVPERGWLKFSRPLNSFLLKYLNRNAFVKSTGTKQIAWCYWPKGYEDFQLLSLSLDMVFDTDHNIIHDPNLSTDQKTKRERQLLNAGKAARFILSSSRSMLDWYQHHRFSNTQLLMNGVFENRIDLQPVSKIKEPYQVTYCGTLSKWMKMDWLLPLIEECPHWIFNFIGENYKTEIASQLSAFSNVRMHGFLEPKDVNLIVKQSNVCFGLYQNGNAFDVNSMKLYDYLSQGVPVVVNEYHPFLEEDFDGLLHIASTYEEFKEAIEHPKPIKIEVLERFLKKATWSERVNPILESLHYAFDKQMKHSPTSKKI